MLNIMYQNSSYQNPASASELESGAT